MKISKKTTRSTPHHQHRPRVYNNTWHMLRDIFLSKTLFLTLLFITGTTGIIHMASVMTPQIGEWMSDTVQHVSTSAIKLASSMGATPIEDTLGNINVLLAGYGGEGHDGGSITDTIMIASYNPQLQHATFISIPRDLYVTYPWGGSGRINALYPFSLANGYTQEEAVGLLAEKLTEIVGLDIPYHALVDFAGFEYLIDELGGIKIDIPHAIYDPLFPGPNNSYRTFRLSAGEQVLDGATALKYVRTRHAEAGQGGDINRAKRGQLVVSAAVNQILRVENITNGGVGAMIDTYNDHVITNVTPNTALGMGRYIDTLTNISSLPSTSWVLNYFYDELYFAQPGGFLMESRINEAYVLLPRTGDTDDYSEIQQFISLVMEYQPAFVANIPLQIENGVSRELLRSTYGYAKPIAGELALDMLVHGFGVQVDGVRMADKPTDVTTLFVYQHATGVDEAGESIYDPLPGVELIRDYVEENHNIIIDEIVYQSLPAPDHDPYMRLVLGAQAVSGFDT